MAVYKPSNCRPFLNSVDLTKDVNVQCEINTSNQNITGYKLRLLNSLNDIIFEGDRYSFLSELENPQSGINGSLLIVPLLIAEYEVNSDPNVGPVREEKTYPRWQYVDSNNIYYVPEGVDWGSTKQYYFKRKVSVTESNKNVFNDTVAEPVENFNNGNANMPYKWEMTLAQSQSANGELLQEPVNDWAYDILVSTGQILGSNYQRIQSNLSDNIYRDYYVQLQTSSGVNVGERVRISSYDRTFGYIYPQEGFITEEEFAQATQFIIYKDTNDPAYVSAGRTVQYALTQSVESGDWWKAFASKGDTKPTNFKVGQLASRGNKYYYDMEVIGITQAQYRNFNSQALPLGDVFPTPGSINGTQIIFSSTRFLFMSQGEAPKDPGPSASEAEKQQYQEQLDKYNSNPYRSTFNALNGVWMLVGAADFKKDTTVENQLEATVQTAKNNLSAAKQAQQDLPEDATEEQKTQAQNAVNNAEEEKKRAEEALTQFRENPSGTCFIRWQRPNDANTWANYIGRNWFVSDGFVGKQQPGADYNSQINLSSNAIAGASGVINTSPLSFFAEEAIVIYPKDNGVPTDAKGIDVTYNKTVPATDKIGIIFRNAPDGSKVYIKPFVGLREGMRINWSNAIGVAYHANISNIDTNYWSVQLNPQGSGIDYSVITTPGTQYKITSFFKTSDENPFYAYTTPTLEIQLKDENGKLQPFGKVVPESPEYPYIPLLNSRYLEVYGKYEQEQHISWKRFRWILFDASVNNTQSTENTYDGEIKYFFDGLQEDHRYSLTLEVEDEQGIVQTAVEEFMVSLKGLGNGEAFPLEVTFDCDTQSVDINFVRNGFVVPDYYNSTIYNNNIFEGSAGYDSAKNGRYTGNDDRPLNEWISPTSTVPNNDGKIESVEYEDAAIVIPNGITVQYENTKALVVGAEAEEDVYVDAKLSAPLENNITFNSSHTNINPYFIGELFEIEINLNDEKNLERVKVGALLPPDTVPANAKIQPPGIVPNPQRNQILMNYWSEKRTAFDDEWNYVGQILPSRPVYFYELDGVNLTPYWREGNPVVYSYQNPDEVENNFDKNPGGKYDYLPITYYNPSDTNQIKDIIRDENGNIVSAIYLEINGVPITTFPTSATPNDLVYYYLGPNELSSSNGVIQFPLSEHSYGYRVSVGTQGSAQKQDFNILLQENPDAVANDNNPRELYRVREFGDPADTTTLTIWQDDITYLAKQIDGSKTLMRAKTYTNAMNNGPYTKNVWHDFRTDDGNVPSSAEDIDNTINIWNDNCALSPSYWNGVSVNRKLNHTGRQEINGADEAYASKEFIFNVALANFDPTEVSFANPAELQAHGWIKRKPNS